MARAGGDRGAAAIASAVSSLLASLGVPHTPATVRAFLGGGGGGGGSGGWGGGGGGGDDFARRVIDAFASPGSVPCVTCDAACLSRARVNHEAVVRAVEHLVRVVDATMRTHAHTSLVQYLHARLVGAVDPRLRARGVPVLGAMGLGPLLSLGALAQYDVTRGVRLQVLGWVFTTYVDYYLQGRVKYDLKNLNAALFGKYRAQTVAFLRGRDADLAPVAGFLARHLLEKNVAAGVGLGCAVCRRAPIACSATRRSRVPAAVARRPVTRSVAAAARTRSARAALGFF